MSPRSAPSTERRRRLTRRAAPVAALAVCSFALGLAIGAGHVPSEQRVAERFAAAWRKSDYADMWALLTPDLQRRIDAATLARAYRHAAAVATVRAMVIGRPRKRRGVYAVPVTARTLAFGTVSGSVRLPLVGQGSDARVDWAPNLAFPGMPRGAVLTRDTVLPPRARLLARDGTPLAEGPDRSSSLGEAARAVVGELGTPSGVQAAALRARGYPDDARVGISGLEKIFETRLAGRPGGRLLAGGRVLASSRPVPAPALRTSIDPAVQQAAFTALAGRLGGVVALRPRTGEVLGIAGIPFSALQPPGSTFKLVTTTAVLTNRLAKPTSSFAFATSTTLAGVTLSNANGESCGGTLAQAFATSCNSVFAPLGAKLGASRLVAQAERFGFNHPAPFGAAESTIPAADAIGDDLAVGASAIGQGRVQATTLEMTSIATTIALGGRAPALTFLPRTARTVGPRVTTAHIAHQVREMMVGVVTGGTGTSAAIQGVTVAGKTGTAELKTTVPCKPVPAPTTTTATTVPNPESCPTDTTTNDPTDTDAWFVGFAPSRHPRIAVGVMLVRAGAGGDTAAPAARQVMLAALQR